VNDAINNDDSQASPVSKDAIKMATGIDIGTLLNNQTIIDALRQVRTRNDNDNKKSKKKKLVKKRTIIKKRSSDSFDIAAIVA